MTDALRRPAYYATGRGTGGLRDWLTLLHPPYTAWHLSYVAIGAALAPQLVLWRLGGTVLAFLLAVGIGAHALDEWHGHPLRTGIPDRHLLVVAALSVSSAVVLGLLYGGWRLVPFIAAGAVLVVGYNLERFGGLLHNDVGFALAWGAFPLLTGYYAQTWTISAGAVLAAAAATALSWAQRALSTPARTIRRRARSVHGTITMDDGTTIELDAGRLIRPLEEALRATAWSTVVLAAALVASRA